jgi:iron(III) transport system permease protein
MSLQETPTRRAVSPAQPARRNRRFPAFHVLAWLLVLAAAAGIIYPLVRLVQSLFFVDGRPTADPFRQAFTMAGIGGAIANTVLVVGCGTLLALIAGCAFAWLNERTDARLGWLAKVLPLVPLLVPPLAGAVGWLFLLEPQSGVLNVALRSALAHLGLNLANGPINILTLPGLIFLYGLILMPYCYLPVANALSQVDPALDEASRVSGARPFRTALRVSLPAVKPAIAVGGLQAAMIGFATLSIPLIIGTPAGIGILSVVIYRLLEVSYPPQVGAATALGCVVLVIILALAAVQRRIVRSQAYSRTVNRNTTSRPIRLGAWRPVARAAMWCFILVAAVLPLAGLVYMSLQPFWTSKLSLAHLSFDNYQNIFAAGQSTAQGLRDSLVLGAAGALIAILAGTVIAMFVAGRPGVVSRGVERIVSLPGTISHLILAVGFLAAFAGAPFYLGNTFTLLLLAYVILFLPLAYFSAAAAHASIPPELLEASSVAGIGPGGTFRRVLLPLMSVPLVGGVITVFVLIVGEFTASVLLAGTGTPVIGFTIIGLYNAGSFPEVAALGVLMTLVTMVVAGSLILISGRRTNATG